MMTKIMTKSEIMSRTIYQIKCVAEGQPERHILISSAEMDCIKIALEHMAMLDDDEYGSVNPSQFILNQLFGMEKNV
jgi:hypothetical protein